MTKNNYIIFYVFVNIIVISLTLLLVGYNERTTSALLSEYSRTHNLYKGDTVVYEITENAEVYIVKSVQITKIHDNYYFTVTVISRITGEEYTILRHLLEKVYTDNSTLNTQEVIYNKKIRQEEKYK